MLDRDILIVENLCNLASIPVKHFRFYAIPLKATAAAMPIRAFAEVPPAGPG